jgi:hypothetical protein
MHRILLDANMPRGLLALLSGYEGATAHQMGWGTLTNGDLLAAAESGGFSLMITADRNIRYQQNMSGRTIALIEVTTTHWETIRDNVTSLLNAIETSEPGSYVTVGLPKPPRRRRAYPLND